MTAGIAPQINNQVDQERARVGRLLQEVEQLCEADIPPPGFFGEMLRRLLEAMGAPAGAVWVRGSAGNVMLQSHINLKHSGIDKNEQARHGHEALLALAFSQSQQMHLPPNTSIAPKEEGQGSPTNPSDYLLLLVPINQNDKVEGVIEVWQNPNRPANTVPGFLHYMGMMANLCGRYQRSQRMTQLATQQKLWSQLEVFAQQVHASLNPVEVAYQVANEGRRLIECDRVSVAIRYGRRTRIEAISGADVVERRSNLVVLMRHLCDSVIDWGEKLVYKGEKDDSLPPKVVKALDEYLAESTSRLLVIHPMRDEREEKDSKKPPRSALVMESFEAPVDPEQMMARTEVIARHAATAIYNAVEYRRIPMRFIWLPLATVQEGLGGPTKAIMALCMVLLTVLISVLLLVPYPLKMDATGNLQPTIRSTIYSPVDGGKINDFKVAYGDMVEENHELAILSDTQLAAQIITLRAEIKNADSDRRSAEEGENRASAMDKMKFANDKDKAQRTLDAKRKQLEDLLTRTGADANPTRPGMFYLKTPYFTAEQAREIEAARYFNHRKEWKVLNANFRDEWKDRAAKASDALIRLGAVDGPWELEIKIPQKHIGQVQKAFELRRNSKEFRLQQQTNPGADVVLDVDFLLRTDPTRTFKGKLYQKRVAPEALPNKEDSGEAEPVVLATVLIDDEGIKAQDRLPPELLLSGAEVHAKIVCGDKPMYYSLFYGVWEFLHEKVIFPFF